MGNRYRRHEVPVASSLLGVAEFFAWSITSHTAGQIGNLGAIVRGAFFNDDGVTHHGSSGNRANYGAAGGLTTSCGEITTMDP